MGKAKEKAQQVLASAKKVHPAIWVVTGLALVGVIYWLTKDKPKPEEKKPKPSSGASGSSGAATSGFSCTSKSGYPIRYGSCGTRVRPLQEHLNTLIMPPLIRLDEDGKFGPDTLAAARTHLGRETFSREYMQSL